MLRSKNILDYFWFRLEDLRLETDLLVDLHLYFEQNKHLILWRVHGDSLSREFVEKYRSRGIDKIWIHNDDKALFNQYQNPTVLQAPTPSQKPVEEASLKAKTIEGAFLTAVQDSPRLNPQQKEEILSKAAQELIREATKPTNSSSQKKINEKMKDIVSDVLAKTMNTTNQAVEEVWKVAHLDPELDHAVTVATYSVLFSMAFGKIKEDLLSDIGLAGLLHDIGLSQIPLSSIIVSWSEQSGEQKKFYSDHIHEGLTILSRLVPEASQRVRDILHQSHEKFDGSGYPQALKGFAFDDVAQLVGMAEVICSLSAGQVDGRERTLLESFVGMEEMEQSRSFPEYFDPEILTRVMKWVRSEESQSGIGIASNVVKQKVKAVIEAA